MGIFPSLVVLWWTPSLPVWTYPKFDLLFFVIPFITDGIGHLFEKNFGLVLIATKLRGSTNSAGATFVENFLFKILLFIETFLFIKIIK